MEKSIKKNYIFNLTFQLVSILTPLIVTPYVSRVLGEDRLGLCSYSDSIAAFFVLVAVLGTTTYGQRAIGYAQKSKEERSRAFWEIFIFRLTTSLVTLAAYVGYVFLFVGKDEFLVTVIFAINILNVIFDITWFMQGMEEFGKTTVRSMIFRILSVASVFLFVKGPSDLYIYVIIMTGSTFLGNVSLWLYLPKYVCRVKGLRPFADIKSIFQLFIPAVAIQMYTVLDKAMIGWLTDGYSENGFYEQAEKVAKTALAAVTALGTVMIPRIALKFKEGKDDEVKYYLYKSYRYVWLMAVPIMFGCIAIANTFVPVFFGENFDKCKILVPILSALTVFIGLSNVTGMQYFIPTGKQNVFTLTVVIGAMVNIILNLILIPFLASVGAAIASVAAEFTVAAVGFIYVKKTKQFSLKPVFTCCLKYWIAGALMFGAVFTMQHFLPVRVWSLVVLILTGMAVYFLLLLLFRDSFLLEILGKGMKSIKSVFKKPVKENVAATSSETGGEENGREITENNEAVAEETSVNAEKTGDGGLSLGIDEQEKSSQTNQTQ